MQGIEFAADRILLGSCREQHLVQVRLERGVPIFCRFSTPPRLLGKIRYRLSNLGGKLIEETVLGDIRGDLLDNNLYLSTRRDMTGNPSRMQSLNKPGDRLRNVEQTPGNISPILLGISRHQIEPAANLLRNRNNVV